MTQSGTGLNKSASWLSRLGAGRLCVALGLALSVAACNNSPYPVGAADSNTLYTAFNERSPRYLDPTSSYTAPVGRRAADSCSITQAVEFWLRSPSCGAITL